MVLREGVMVKSDGGKKVTLKDVSKAAGLSLITVSRALRQPETVHPDTRAKVQKTIEEIGYIPNLAARSLVSQRSDMVGVVVPILASSLFADFAEGVSKTLEPNGQRLLLAVSNWSPEIEEAAVRTFIARQADAIILTGFSQTETTRKLLERFHGPVVQTWNIHDSAIDTAVGFDNRAAAAEMTRYLIDKGYQEIVVVGGSASDNDQSADRVQGFLDAMTAAGREVRADSFVEFPNPATIDVGAPIVQELLARETPPDAVFFLAELPAHGAMLWCHSQGIRVPEQLAIAGFGDLSLSALLPTPMTTVKIPGREIGEQAAKQLIKRLEGHQAPTAVKNVGYQLSLRASA